MGLTNILYPITEPIADFYTKIKAAITALISFEGGTAGQILEKVDGTDYNVQWATKPDYTIPVFLDSGPWNMSTTGTISITHGIADIDKIRSVNVIVRDDGGTKRYDFFLAPNSVQQGRVSGRIVEITSTVITLTRTNSADGGPFDAGTFNDGVINRAKITINCIP